MNSDLGILARCQAQLAHTGFDALLVVGVENVQYLSTAHVPFLFHRPDLRVAVLMTHAGDAIYLCPDELVPTVRPLSSIQPVLGYSKWGHSHGGFLQAITELVKAKVPAGSTVGVDEQLIPHDLYGSLENELVGITLTPCDGWLASLRMVKTQPELELLEELAYTTDHGLNGRFHHIIANRPKSMISLAEEVRVHCLERGLDELGYHSTAQSVSGTEATRFWPLCPLHGLNYGFSPAKDTQTNVWVRNSMITSRQGYWSNACRMFVYGVISDAQRETYDLLMQVRNAIVEAIEPGVPCNDLYDTAQRTARRVGAQLVAGMNVGHGIGVLISEPPYINEYDQTEIREGMVLVIDPILTAPGGEIIRSKDTVIITSDGCKVVNWWKDWREPYLPIPFL